MSKQSERRARASARRETIVATGSDQPIHAEAVSIDWIAAAGDAGDSKPRPKRFSMVAYSGGPMQVNNYGSSD